MGKFDDLKKKIDDAEAQAQARVKAQQDQIAASQAEQKRLDAERANKASVLTNKLLKPTLQEATHALGLKNAVLNDTPEPMNVKKSLSSGTTVATSFTRLVDFKFTKPPASQPNTLLWSFIFGTDFSVFYFYPAVWSGTSLGYGGPAALAVDISGDLTDAKIAEMRSALEDALATEIEKIMAFR